MSSVNALPYSSQVVVASGCLSSLTAAGFGKSGRFTTRYERTLRVERCKQLEELLHFFYRCWAGAGSPSLRAILSTIRYSITKIFGKVSARERIQMAQRGAMGSASL